MSSEAMTHEGMTDQVETDQVVTGEATGPVAHDGPGPDLDEGKVGAFSELIFGHYVSAMVTLVLDLSHRTGLLEAVAQGPGTSQQLAERAGLQERYVRECLGCLVTAGIVEHDAVTRAFRFVPEHAVVLSGPGALNLAPMSRIAGLLGPHVTGVARAAREGGGVPYEAFRPEFTTVMDGLSRGTMDDHLIQHLVPLTGPLAQRLASGIRVADVGCGTGHSTNVLARAFPASSFIGYDIAEDAISQARDEARADGLQNVTFEVLDVTQLPEDPPLDAVFAFDAIHDQVDPVTVLQRIAGALIPGGVFVMMDVKAHSDLEANRDNPFAPLLYAVSTLHCMTVSLAHDGAGLGTVWGEELACRMLADAGFVDVVVHDVPDDPIDSLYVCHKPT